MSRAARVGWQLAAVAAGIAGLAAAAAPAETLSLPVTRYPLQVESRGPLRIPLPADRVPRPALLRLAGPSGGELPFELQRLPSAAERQAVEVVAVEETAQGWAVRLDTGALPERHQRLLFSFRRPVLAPEVVLEAERPGGGWQPLARADLFRLGERQGLSRTALDYPASRARRLRLLWPRAAELPELAAVEVVTVDPALEGLTLQPPCAVAAAGEALVCRLETLGGGRRVHRLELEVAAKGWLGYRLAAAEVASWRLLAEGRWGPVEQEVRRVEVPARGSAAPALRLELYGERAVPALRRVVARVDSLLLAAAAEEAGRHLLTVGAGRSAGEPGLAVAAPAAQVVPLGNGADGREELRVPAAGAPRPDVDFRASWEVARLEVEAPAPVVDGLVRLPVPAVVRAAAAADLRDLRLVAAGRQVPYLLLPAAVPEPARAWQGVAPEPAGEGRSELSLSLPQQELPPGSLHLSRDGPFSRRARLELPLPGRPGAGAATAWSSGWRSWECAARPPLPCRLVIDTRAVPAAAAGLRLVFDDGDNPPLPPLDAEWWVEGHDLLFPWPPAGAVRLLAGASGLAPPRYDLAAMESVLAALPAAPAVLAARQDATVGGWQRPLLLTALALAALAMLWLLARTLRQ
ncbi:MAG TPA: hypothetical protein VMT16_00630 [Thermoanaerobaculia bacterium]|nr:hypothetical protein [Thermoanaerobaculia bacterium]